MVRIFLKRSNIYTMKKREYMAYESPKITVMETVIEGLLCASKVDSDLTVDPWEGDGDFDW